SVCNLDAVQRARCVWPLSHSFRRRSGTGDQSFWRRRLGPDRMLTCRLKYFSSAATPKRTSGGGWQNYLSDEIGLPLKSLTNMRELDRRSAARNYPSLRFKTTLTPDGRRITVVPDAVALGMVGVFAL